MSSPDSVSLETLSPAELRDLVGALLSKVTELSAANAVLKEDNQALREEVARLKGLPPPSQLDTSRNPLVRMVAG